MAEYTTYTFKRKFPLPEESEISYDELIRHEQEGENWMHDNFTGIPDWGTKPVKVKKISDENPEERNYDYRIKKREYVGSNNFAALEQICQSFPHIKNETRLRNAGIYVETDAKVSDDLKYEDEPIDKSRLFTEDDYEGEYTPDSVTESILGENASLSTYLIKGNCLVFSWVYKLRARTKVTVLGEGNQELIDKLTEFYSKDYVQIEHHKFEDPVEN